MPHILDAQIPEVNPTGAPGGDFENIKSSPEAFGGFGAQAEEKFGAGLEKAGTTGIDLATQIQTEVNDTHAAQLQTGYARESTDLFTKYDGLQGQAKMSALPQFKEDLGKLRDKYLSAAPSLQEKTRLAPALSGLEDRYYYYATAGASHAQTQYFREVAADKKEMHGGQALLSWSQGDPQGFYNEVANAAQETRNEKEAAGLDEDSIETEAKKTRGVYVREAIKMTLAQGDPHNVAPELAEKYKGLVDPASMVQINELLNAHRDQKSSDLLSQRALTGVTPVQQAVSQAAQATGLDPAMLSRVVHVESGGRAGPEADTGKYKGLFQLSQAEFNRYGGGDIYNPVDNAMAAAKKIKAEGAQFTAEHGRPPTNFDAYMIHQQGAAGYNAHLARPDAPASQNMFSTGEGQQKGIDWSRQAIWGNIPDQNKAQLGLTVASRWQDLTPQQKAAVDGVSSRQFLGLWQPKIGGQDAPAPSGASNVRSSAYQAAMSDPAWGQASPEVQHQTLTKITQAVNDAEIASNQDAKSKKANVDHVAGGYITEFYDMLHSPNPDFVALAGRINHDPALADSPTEKASLMERVRKASGEEQSLNFGPGYHDARAALFSDPDAPGHAASVAQFANDDNITMAGLEDLNKRFKMAKSSPDRMANEKIITSFLTDAKQQMVHDQDIGTVKIPDPKGAHLYNSEFVPRFVKQAAKLQEDADKTGNTDKLDKFLSRENVDKMINEVYPKSQRNADAISALGGALPTEAPNAPLPPAPDDVDPVGWKTVIASPPKMATGQTATHQQYALALQTLKDNPTPDMKTRFNKWFGVKGQMADDVLGKLVPQKQ